MVVAELRRHPHLVDQLAELPAPIVEAYVPGHLSTGRFKVPLYVDESRSAAPVGSQMAHQS